MIRIAMVDDHPVVRRGLRALLEAEDNIAIVAETGDPENVVPMLEQHPADVLLLDLSLPGRGGIELLGDVLREWPALRVLVISTHAESQYAVRAIRAGAAGYVLKTSAPEELIRAVRNVASSGHHISEAVAAELASYTRRSSRAGLEALSDREYEVMRLITEGLSTGDIAARLSLSVKTVSTYRARVLQKLELNSVAELVRYAIEHGVGS